MILVFYILMALILDYLIGDPRWLPHPVKLIGALAQRLEAPMRHRFTSAKTAGVVTAVIVIGATAGVFWGCLLAAGRIAPWLGHLTAILMLYTTVAARDLDRHGRAVLAALDQGDLTLARQRLSRIVGRDTTRLDEHDVVRAAVESVAENSVDGVIAPLFFAFLGGPVAAMAYKAISTLDSTFGYRNERYLTFGWASARIDDTANYLPARLGVLLLAATAWAQDLDFHGCLRMARRDGAKHASPNAGLAEAAMAGALGVQLGGPVTRHGHAEQMPYLGDSVRPLAAQDIATACRLMLGATVAAFLSFGAVRVMVWFL